MSYEIPYQQLLHVLRRRWTHCGFLPLEKIMWTRFMDMCSGGSEKLLASNIWIEAGVSDAVAIFEGIFDRDPYNVTCSCCGDDYAVYQDDPKNITNSDYVVTATDIANFLAGKQIPHFK